MRDLLVRLTGTLLNCVSSSTCASTKNEFGGERFTFFMFLVFFQCIVNMLVAGTGEPDERGEVNASLLTVLWKNNASAVNRALCKQALSPLNCIGGYQL